MSPSPISHYMQFSTWKYRGAVTQAVFACFQELAAHSLARKLDLYLNSSDSWTFLLPSSCDGKRKSYWMPPLFSNFQGAPMALGIKSVFTTALHVWPFPISASCLNVLLFPTGAIFHLPEETSFTLMSSLLTYKFLFLEHPDQVLLSFPFNPYSSFGFLFGSPPQFIS